MRLQNKIAIVTGGGQGIGRGIALQFAREGAKVTIAQRSEEKLARTTKEIEEIGGEVLAIPTDVGQEADVERMVEATRERFGSLDILVNNAGIGLRVPVDETEMKDYDRLMDTNLKGLYMGCHFAVPLMKARGKGAIINIASVHGINGAPLNTVYAATKGGIIGCTRALASELAPFLIRVNTISPGAIHIEKGLENRLARIDEQYHQEFLERFGERLREGHKYFQPLEIVGDPIDIAHCAVYLASDEARFVTGQNVAVDGGLTTFLTGFISENGRKWQAQRRDNSDMQNWIEAHEKKEEDQE